MDDVTLWPAHRQAAAIAAGELSSRELLAAELARIEAVNPALNAVVSLDVERAEAAAAAADAAVARGDALGRLHGLPITLKDAYEVAGWTSTGGSALLATNVPVADAPVVAALRRAGVVLLGRTNVPEWSGDVQTYNEVFGTTNNPWDTTRTPGGSSGGAGAAVATGMTSFEVGTDIGGSIRVPASFNGICGHKPSWGVVPTGGYLDHAGVGNVEREVNVFGPLARSVDDLELVLDVVAGPAPRESIAWRLELPAARAMHPRELRVAAWLDEASCPTDPAVLALLSAAVDAFETAGAAVDRAARPDLDWAEAAQVGMGIVGGEVSVSTADDAFEALASFPDALPPNVAMLASGLTQRHREWLLVQEHRRRHQLAWDDFFSDWDVLLAPVCVAPPIPHDNEGSLATRTVVIDGVERPYIHLILWTTLIGSASLPSTVVPVGGTAGGLPIGIQVIGPHLEDRTALAAARLLTDLTGGYVPPPLVTG